MPASALEIYQEYLDLTGEALLTRDAEAFIARIFLPHQLITETQTFHMEDDETIRHHFFGFANALASQDVDAYVRIGREAQFDDATHLHGTHDSFLTSRGKLVVPRFSNETALERRGGIWGSTKTRHFTAYVSWPDILPRGDVS